MSPYLLLAGTPRDVNMKTEIFEEFKEGQRYEITVCIGAGNKSHFTANPTQKSLFLVAVVQFSA